MFDGFGVLGELLDDFFELLVAGVEFFLSLELGGLVWGCEALEVAGDLRNGLGDVFVFILREDLVVVLDLGFLEVFI